MSDRIPEQLPDPTIGPSIQESDQPKEPISQIYFNIDDIENIEQLRTLTVKQLKLILTRNFIDYKGCLEREELLARAERLWNDRQENKQSIVKELICDSIVLDLSFHRCR